VLEDADLNLTVERTLGITWTNSGQVCGAWTWMIVPVAKHDEIVRMLIAAAAQYTVGDPTDEATRIEPVASEAQWNSVNGYIERGVVSTSSADEQEPQDGLGLCSDSVITNLAAPGVQAAQPIRMPRTRVQWVGGNASGCGGRELCHPR